MLDEHAISSQVVLNLVLNYSSQVVIKINNRRYIDNTLKSSLETIRFS